MLTQVECSAGPTTVNIIDSGEIPPFVILSILQSDRGCHWKNIPNST